jgi:hypothetical protein
VVLPGASCDRGHHQPDDNETPEQGASRQLQAQMPPPGRGDQDAHDQDWVSLVLLRRQCDQRQAPAEDGLAAEPGPTGQQGDGERENLGMKIGESSLLQRGPGRQRTGQRHREPGALRQQLPGQQVARRRRRGETEGVQDRQEPRIGPTELEQGRDDQQRFEMKPEEAPRGEPGEEAATVADIPDQLLKEGLVVRRGEQAIDLAQDDRGVEAEGCHRHERDHERGARGPVHLRSGHHRTSRQAKESVVVISTHPDRVLATGQRVAWREWARSAASRLSSGHPVNRYSTRIRLMINTLSSTSTSPSAAASRLPFDASIPRASSAPPRVPTSQPAAAATT